MELYHLIKLYKSTIVILFLYVFLATIFLPSQLIDILLHTSINSGFYLYFLCMQMLWSYSFYQYIDHYHALDIMIRTRMTHLHFLFILFKRIILYAFFYFVFHCFYFLLICQQIPWTFLFLSLSALLFSTLIILCFFYKHQYSYVMMVLLIVLIHLFI